MKKFVRLIIIFLLPFILFYSPYIIGDPFKVLRKYKMYYPEDGGPLWININRGHVSTRMYTQYKDTYQWNSFIFGSSRSGAYHVDEWKQYIGSDCRCFHFDGYGESLYNVYKKVKYLDGKSPIDNALFCIDEMLLSKASPDYGHLWITSPTLEDGTNWTDWHISYLKAYSRFDFIRAYLDFSFTHKVKPYMVESGVIDTVPFGLYDISANEKVLDLTLQEPDSIWYTPTRLAKFPDRSQSRPYHKSILTPKHIAMLSEIEEVLRRNNTNYKVIINPTYDQKLYKPQDLHILDSIFGEHLFDFSGRNRITEDYHNYVDPVHYKSQIANQIMRIIYTEDAQARKASIDSIYHFDTPTVGTPDHTKAAR